MQNPMRLHAGGGESNNSHALMNASAIKTRQAMVANQQQHVQKQQSIHYVVLKVRPGGNNIHPSNKSVIITRSSSPQRVTPEGVAIGTLSTAVFYCNNDPMVSPEHGTLECTMKHGVWVYVDHSIHGTKLNNSRRIHKEAVVVRSGDRLLVGNTEVELYFETSSSDNIVHRKDDAPSRHSGSRQQQAQSQGSATSNNLHNQSGIASSPITFPAPTGEGAARSKLDQFKIEKPKIDTSGATFSAATPLEYIASPVSVVNQRRKRHSMTAFTPSPPGGGSGGGFGTAGNPFNYQRTRPLVPSAPSTPPRIDATRPCTAANISPHQSQGIMKWRSNQPEDSNKNSSNDEIVKDTSVGSRSTRPERFTPPPPPPPPLAYSSSPVTAPSVLQRMHLPQSPSPPLVPQQQQQHQRMHSEAPKSHRDNLRIQVSKKMAGYQAAARGGGGKIDGPSGGRPVPSGLKIPLPSTPPLAPLSSSSRQSNNNQLDFTPPSSPVAHKDILRQKESLLNILKTKYKEEQLLKQQQEEWMRHNFSLATPPMSPIKSKTTYRHHRQSTGSGDDSQDVTIEEDDDDDMSDIEMPPRAPELLRTISLGIHQASPRLTAAVLASRARVNSFDDKRSPRTANTNASQESMGLSSVSSSVSTELACHRRVTKSLSVSSSEDFISSADINDFMGYEEEVGDDLTSFTTHSFYPSDDCRSNLKDDSMRQFSSSSSSSYYNTSSSSSLRSPTTAKDGVVLSTAPYKRRFSIGIVSSREPEEDDEENQQSPENALHVMRKAESTPNLFDDKKRASPPPAYKSVVRRYSRVKDPSPIEVPAAMGISSPSVARRFRRLPSPV